MMPGRADDDAARNAERAGVTMLWLAWLTTAHAETNNPITGYGLLTPSGQGCSRIRRPALVVRDGEPDPGRRKRCSIGGNAPVQARLPQSVRPRKDTLGTKRTCGRPWSRGRYRGLAMRNQNIAPRIDVCRRRLDPRPPG